MLPQRMRNEKELYQFALANLVTVPLFFISRAASLTLFPVLSI